MKGEFASWNLGCVETAFLEAATMPSRWSQALEVVTSITGSVGAIILPFDHQSSTAWIPRTDSVEDLLKVYFSEGWYNQDPRRRVIPALKRRGVCGEFQHATMEEIDRHPFYRDYLRRFDLRWSAQVRVSVGDELWCLSIQRSIDQHPFSNAEIQRLSFISPKISGAAMLANSLGFAGLETAMNAFEMSKKPVFFVNGIANILKFNAPAERLIGVDLQIRNGKLRSQDATASAALDAALSKILDFGSLISEPVLLPRVDRQPLLAHVTRIAGLPRDIFSPAQAIIVICDPEAQLDASEVSIRSLFGLTRAEARLATRLARGEALNIAAQRVGVRIETARKMLKAIFQKMNINRQAELVLLISRCHP